MLKPLSTPNGVYLEALVLVAFSGFGLTSYAQQWCIPGARWYYTDIELIYGYSKYTFVGDTLIGDIEGKIIKQESNGYAERVVTRAADGVVYIHQDFPEWSVTRWDTVIWFDAVPGDSWSSLNFVDRDCGCGCFYSVTDTGHVELEGQWLHTVEVQNDCVGGFPFAFVERIGSDQRPLFWRCVTDISTESALRCYSDDQIAFETGIVPFCSAGVKEQDRSMITIAPNPGRDIVRIRSGGTTGTPRRVQFIDAFGRISFEQSAIGDAEALDTGALASGLYVVRVLDGNSDHRVAVGQGITLSFPTPTLLSTDHQRPVPEATARTFAAHSTSLHAPFLLLGPVGHSPLRDVQRQSPRSGDHCW